MTTKFILYYHKSLALTNYLRECSPTLAAAHALGNVSVQSFPQQNAHEGFATLPTALRRLLFFAKPDAVICIDDGLRPIHPIFAFETTDHVPAQDHWMQRFNHLVGCAQEGVPGAYILPFSMPNRPKFASKLDHVFFYAYERVTEIHGTAMYIAEWEVVNGATTRCDPKYASLPDRNTPDMKRTFEYLERVLEYAIHGRPLRDLMRERLIVDLRDRIRSRAYARIPEIRDFGRLKYHMPNNRPLSGKEFAAAVGKMGLKLPPDLPDRMKKRDKYVIFVPQPNRKNKTLDRLGTDLADRISKRGGDPYLGQPLAFDYMFCRLGPTTYERDCNLVIDLSVLKFKDMAAYHKEVWKKSPLQYTSLKDIHDIPTYTMYLKEGSAQVLKNVLRVYAFAADMILYRDGIVYF
jgi:hypothetical protein